MLPIFTKQFPNHSYTKNITKLLNAICNVKIGSDFIDFSAPDIDGNVVKVSDVIKSKVAVIDLWSSWCGPCRRRSKSMIPIYNKYKNKGFTIIGTACEFKNTENFKLALKNDGYPWLNLVELDNKNSIWSKYGIQGSGGCTYLVDSNGVIVAIAPTIEELEGYLKKLLN